MSSHKALVEYITRVVDGQMRVARTEGLTLGAVRMRQAIAALVDDLRLHTSSPEVEPALAGLLNDIHDLDAHAIANPPQRGRAQGDE